MVRQFNVAQMKYSKDAAEIQSFFVETPHIQRLTESSPDFVWRERKCFHNQVVGGLSNSNFLRRILRRQATETN